MIFRLAGENFCSPKPAGNKKTRQERLENYPLTRDNN
jgi:hypothetical protein